ncbi:MAG TPA: aminoglycoside 6-adenylyltransferase [Hanamia sp.]|nr:aminoglycoside 6-adenylyltransferase [Hanamia sp.]
MRRDEEMIAQILHVAKADNRIRAVLLTGSRADPTIIKDRFQDFDIIYIVTRLDTFIKDRHWIDLFGERLIVQLPDEMGIGDKDNCSFHYLMLFKDYNRIDLTLFPLEKLKNEFKRSSLTTVLLDKDNLFENIPQADNSDYLINRPTGKEFADCSNEFWWVSTYVAKGLWRNEVTYAKEMLEVPVRTMFLKVIEWYIGILTDFTVSFGKGGRNMKECLPPVLYDKILSTYPDSNIKNIWHSLLVMTQLFDELAGKIATAMNFDYDTDTVANVTSYLNSVYEMSKKK